jgi:hypothetical protein
VKKKEHHGDVPFFICFNGLTILRFEKQLLLLSLPRILACNASMMAFSICLWKNCLLHELVLVLGKRSVVFRQFFKSKSVNREEE